jgi:hypothetical protein
LLACSSSSAGDGGSDGGGSSADASSSDVIDGGGGGDSDGGSSAIDGGGSTGPVTFIAMGDTGEGNTDQSLVADAIKTVCDNNGGCDFVILLGDNIYDGGVDGNNDPQWESKFETPYMNLDMPFYAVLGNHDYGGNVLGSEQGGLGNEFDKGPNEVAYTQVSTKWKMPSTYYTMIKGNVGFIMLDTNSILWDDTTNGDQKAWWSTAMSEISGATWKFAAAHHPYLSNGAHGNAGSYESIEIGGIEVTFDFIPQVSGNYVKSFFETYICGNVDVSFSGHDHNRQWINEPTKCQGTELIVSGAGAKVKDFSSSLNTVHFGDATTPGFMWVRVDGNRLTGRFYDKNGTMQFERQITK